MQYLNGLSLSDLSEFGRRHYDSYQSAAPFPNGSFDDFFSAESLRAMLEEFPDLRGKPDRDFNTPNEVKRVSSGEYRFGPQTRSFMHFLNSQPFLEFLSALTGIEGLMPDPYFEGGGCHEILPGGYLKLHADFNKHRRTKLDRRLNVLIYLNEDWKEEYGGHFEMWNKDMTQCAKKILPIFNRMAIFTTTDFSFHGHPEPLTCPPNRSRRSLALYYYTNGRPAEEINGGVTEHSTLFVYRGDNDRTADEYSKRIFEDRRIKSIAREFVPPVLLNSLRRMQGKRLR